MNSQQIFVFKDFAHMNQRYDDSNVFAKIIKGDLSVNKVLEDQDFLAFHDISPAAALHIIVIPKDKFISMADFTEFASAEYMKNFFLFIHKIVKKFDLDKTGYRLITNHGKNGAQTVEHFHIHILGQSYLGPLTVIDKHHE